MVPLTMGAGDNIQALLEFSLSIQSNNAGGNIGS